ncbi:MAG TPA: ABC transporter permease [Bauldia sp.]|nr:ABC transporter permease [Bauldia sp.]
METVKYLVRRFAFLVLVVFAAGTLNFFLPRLTGQDPIRSRLLDEMKNGASFASGISDLVKVYDEKFGLDLPLWHQYLNYLGDMSRLDLGQSFTSYPRTVAQLIGDALPWTVGLLTVTTLVSFALGSLLGALVGWPKSPAWIRAIAPPVFTLAAIPYYLLGLAMLWLFAFELHWLPGSGGYRIGTIPSHTWKFAFDVLQHSVLPALSIILSSVGFWALSMRSMMVGITSQDYVAMAEAKGLTNRTILVRYGLRNVMLPQITALALELGYVVSGTILVEVVFTYPGIGLLLFNSIKLADFPVIQGIVFTLIVSLAVATLILDLALPFLDPRIRRRA